MTARCERRRFCLDARRLLGVASALLWLGCAANTAIEKPMRPPSAEPAGETDPVVVAPDPLDEERKALAHERLRSIELEQELVRLRAALSEARQRNETLEEELASSLDEVLRAKASIRGVHSRALATSRIAEVRVALEAQTRALESKESVDLARAVELLERADEELVAENFGGAVYLAERASDLVRQARSTTPVAAPAVREEVVPVLPVRLRKTTSPTNLREGPGVEFARKGLIPLGERVSVLASAGEWRHIERSEGQRGWVHSRLLVEASGPSPEVAESSAPEGGGLQ